MLLRKKYKFMLINNTIHLQYASLTFYIRNLRIIYLFIRSHKNIIYNWCISYMKICTVLQP